MKNKKLFILSCILFGIFIIFTFLLRIIDVNDIGINNSLVGFSTINEFVHNKLGVHMIWYDITDWLGIIPIVYAASYGLIGAIQLFKTKDIKKVDKEIIYLGVLYILVIGLYVFFEKFVINYRPVLMDGLMETSFPSSHTLVSICVCGSSIMINKKLFNNKFTKYMNIVSYLLIGFIVVGRVISGVHWVTDIIASLTLSSAILLMYYFVINKNVEK